MQARLAPIALLVALAFMIVGFLRADREMTQAERDRAVLTASETATLVEVFLLRQVTRLQSIERVARAEIRDSLMFSQFRDASEALRNFGGDQFDQLWAVVPNSRGHTIAQLDKRATQPVVDSSTITELAKHYAAFGPKAVVVHQNGRTTLWLVESIGSRSSSSIIALVSLDSLSDLLRRQRHSGSVGITVTAPADTILFLPDNQPNNRRRSVERSL